MRHDIAGAAREFDADEPGRGPAGAMVDRLERAWASPPAAPNAPSRSVAHVAADIAERLAAISRRCEEAGGDPAAPPPRSPSAREAELLHRLASLEAQVRELTQRLEYSEAMEAYAPATERAAPSPELEPAPHAAAKPEPEDAPRAFERADDPELDAALERFLDGLDGASPT